MLPCMSVAEWNACMLFRMVIRRETYARGCVATSNAIDKGLGPVLVTTSRPCYNPTASQLVNPLAQQGRSMYPYTWVNPFMYKYR